MDFVQGGLFFVDVFDNGDFFRSFGLLFKLLLIRLRVGRFFFRRRGRR